MPFDPVSSANGVWLGVSVIALAVVFQYVVLATLTDGFRDRLFSLRRELFLLVARGEISRNDRAYRHLRDDLNTYIRYAERMTFARTVMIPLAVLAFGDNRVKRNADRHHAETINGVVDDNLRMALRRIDDQAAQAIALHVLASSPVVWVFAVIALPFALLVALASGGTRRVKDHVVTKVSDRAKCEVELLAA